MERIWIQDMPKLHALNYWWYRYFTNEFELYILDAIRFVQTDEGAVVLAKKMLDFVEVHVTGVVVTFDGGYVRSSGDSLTIGFISNEIDKGFLAVWREVPVSELKRGDVFVKEWKEGLAWEDVRFFLGVGDGSVVFQYLTSSEGVVKLGWGSVLDKGCVWKAFPKEVEK